MENNLRPMRKNSYSFVDESSGKRFDDDKDPPMPCFGSNGLVSHSKSHLNTFSVREIGGPVTQLDHSMAGLHIHHHLDPVETLLIPHEIIEKNARINCIYDFILSMILSYVNYLKVTDEKIVQIFNDNFEIATEPKYVNFRTSIEDDTLAISPESFMLIDCRFEYEFEGGHITDAVNINDPNVIKYLFIENEELFTDFKFRKYFQQYKGRSIDFEKAHQIIQEFREFNPTSLDLHTVQSPGLPLLNHPMSEIVSINSNTQTSGTQSQSNRRDSCLDDSLSFVSEKRRSLVVVFYCEFSSERAPSMWRLLRSADRDINPYPYLYYNDIYLLNGGYKKFVEQYPSQCLSSDSSNKYVSMWDKKYEDHRSLSMNKLNNDWRIYNKQKKAKTPLTMSGLGLKDLRGKRMSVPIQASESLFKLFSKQL